MEKRSYLLISLDSVRGDVAYSGKYATLDRLRSEGICFRKVVSVSPLTPVAHASMLSGLYPFHHGIRHLFREALADHVVTLAQYFRQADYQTGAIVSCPGMNRWYGFNRGFQHYDDEIPLLPDGSNPLLSTDVALRGQAAKRAEVVVDRALDWISQRQAGPKFLFLHFFDAHWPYDPPEPFGRRFRDNPYEGEVAYMDHQLGRLFSGLTDLGLQEEFTSIITSDHGEDLEGLYPNDHGGAKFGNPHERGHGCLLYGSTQYVFLILHNLPGVTPGTIVTRQVRSIDVAPSLLAMAAFAPLPAAPMDGRSLLPYLRGEGSDLQAYSETFYPEEYRGPVPADRHLKPLYSMRLITGEAEIAMIWSQGEEGFEIYDLKADPQERNNLFR